MAAHRYWRVYVDAANGSGYVTCTELRLLLADDTNVATTGTASASSTGFGLGASNANNGSDTGNCWHSGNNGLDATDEWLKIDLGAGNAQDVVAFGWTSRADVGQPATAPKNFKLQYSDDDSVWTDLITVTGATAWAQGEVRYYTSGSGSNSIPARYWRVFVSATQDGGNSTNAAELEFRASAGGADETGSGTAFATSVYLNMAAYAASKAFDNDNSSMWASDGAVPHGIGYDFGLGVSKAIVEIAYRIRNDGFPNQSPKDFKLQYRSSVANPWSDLFSVTGEAGWSNGEQRVFPRAGVAARPVVFTST